MLLGLTTEHEHTEAIKLSRCFLQAEEKAKMIQSSVSEEKKLLARLGVPHCALMQRSWEVHFSDRKKRHSGSQILNFGPKES